MKVNMLYGWNPEPIEISVNVAIDFIGARISPNASKYLDKTTL